MEIRIGVDIMGGDQAPVETTLGCIQALGELPASTRLVLLGDRERILPLLREHGVDEKAVDLVHTTEVITYTDAPTKAFSQKPDSSIAVGFRMLKEKSIDAFASAGNTGAMMVGAMFSVKTIPGILRPTISAILPKPHGGVGVLLDVGINVDCKPEMLVQFAMVGSLYAEHVFHIKKPKIGLMNVGEEAEKGDLLSQATHTLLKQAADLHFIGNVEGRDLFNDRADVIVCDGFTGNVMLKEAESFYWMIKKRGISDPYLDRFNFEDYGGTPLLGVNAPVMIAHGISKARAIKNMVLLSHNVVEARLHDKIAGALASPVA
jgi:glycerol-3-phosphate acyltransferase PlsX